MDPISETGAMTRRDFLRFSYGNSNPPLQEEPGELPKTEAESNRQIAVNQQLERMGFLDTKAVVKFIPGDHMLNPAHLRLFHDADAITGEIGKDTMHIYNYYIENPGLLTNAIPEVNIKKKKRNPLWALMNPGIEEPTQERIAQAVDVYRQLEEKGVRIYTGDVTNNEMKALSNADPLESTNTLNVGLAGISALLQVGLIGDSIASIRSSEPMTRRKLLRIGGSIGIAAALNKVLRLQMGIDWHNVMSLGRQKSLEGAIDVEASIEEAMRDLGLTDAQYDVYTKMLVDHRNNLMGLHTWRALAEEAQSKDDPVVATYYGPGHGRTEDIFDKGPDYCEEQIYTSATTYLTEGLDYLFESGLDDDAVIVALGNGMKLYPPCVRHGDIELRDPLSEQLLPRTAQMIFGDSLLEQLDNATTQGDQRREHILTEVMRKYIEQVEQRIDDEKKLAQRDRQGMMGYIDENLIVHRRDVRPEHNEDEFIDQTYIETDPAYSVTNDGYLQIGLYRDTQNVYPLVLNTMGGSEGGDLVLQEAVLAADGYLVGLRYECETSSIDELPDGKSRVIFVENDNLGKRVARDILYIKPGDRSMFEDYDVYRLSGTVAGLESPIILRHKDRG